MLTLKSKMNTNAQPEPLSEDVVIITDSDDFDKLRQNPDCVCVIVKGCSYIEIGAFEDMKAQAGDFARRYCENRRKSV